MRRDEGFNISIAMSGSGQFTQFVGLRSYLVLLKTLKMKSNMLSSHIPNLIL